MTTNNQIPTWIESKLFENILKRTIPNFKNIKAFKAYNALAPGENYATIMLKIEIEVNLKDETTLTETLMMKVAHDSELYRENMSKWPMFAVESLMYREIVPEMEQIYANAGANVCLGAKGYQLDTEKEYILLEDLKKKNFRNAKRQVGLDMEHCKSVLSKLAQWHAASAVRVDQKGPYEEKYVMGIPNKAGKDFFRSMMDVCVKNVLNTVKSLENHTIYYEQMHKLCDKFTDVLFDETGVDLEDFNVLNHGDCWTNNIMFQYDEEGKLLQTYLVDLQTPRYGTVAQDILYFILSSAKLDIKISRFDEMVKYYHEQLIGNLKLLKYAKTYPSLADLHKMLIKSSIWAGLAVINVLPPVLAEPCSEASVDNLVGDSEESARFKQLMYDNSNLKEHYKLLLPWMYYRGAFDIE